MADAMTPGGEAPVNPYNLLEAVNRASAATRLGWLLGLAVFGVLAVALAGVTHRDLLLQSDVAVLGVRLPLIAFFISGPLVVLAVHAALLLQHAVLAEKVQAFDAAIRLLETSERRTHPLRLEVHPYGLTEAMAGPRRALALGFGLGALTGVSLVLLPTLLLLAFQATFLAYHAPTITWWHRGLVLVDLGLVTALGVLVAAPGRSWAAALGRTVAVRPFQSFAALVAMLAIAFVAIFGATVPGEPLEGVLRPGANAGQTGFALPGAARVASFFDMWLKRNLQPSRGLLDEAGQAKGAAGIDLSGRDLAGAALDGQRLARADLAGANLRGARLVHADLSAADLSDADLAGAVLDRAHLANADLSRASLVGASLKDASLDAARMVKVRAAGASFERASLGGADLATASLLGADFLDANLLAADLMNARLEGARLRNADLEAAVLAGASLVGADLTEARIAEADFRRARVWRTTPPQADAGGLAEFADIDLRQPDGKSAAEIDAAIASVGMKEGETVLRDVLRPVLDATERGKWAGSADLQRWQGLASAAPLAGSANRTRLSETLARIACRQRAGEMRLGAAVSRRVLAKDFRGDAAAFYDRLKGDDCVGARSIPARMMQALAVLAERSAGAAAAAGAGGPSAQPAGARAEELPPR